MKWRNDVVKYLLSSLEKCGADGVWVVNSDLQDEQGSHPNEEERFPGLIEFHKELRAKLADGIRILAGPYWAMNLVLWARGLIQNPVIAIATGYQHHISGGRVKAPSDRLVIPPLRRRVTTPNLGTWLQNAHRMLLGTAAPASKIGGIGSSFAQAAQELAPLSRQLNRLKGDLAHEQVARFYRDWIAGLEKTPPRMRALALHQDLSSAHVVGSILGDLPKGNKPRQAGKLAKQYMLSCL